MTKDELIAEVKKIGSTLDENADRQDSTAKLLEMKKYLDLIDALEEKEGDK